MRPPHGGVGPVATRLPPMFGFIVTSLLLFVFVASDQSPDGTCCGALAGLHDGLGLCDRSTSCTIYDGELRRGVQPPGRRAAAGRHARLHLVVMSSALAVYVDALLLRDGIRADCRRGVRPAGRTPPVRSRPMGCARATRIATLPLLPLVAVVTGQRTTFWARPRSSDSEAFIVLSLVHSRDGEWQRAAGTVLIVAVGTFACLPVHRRTSRRLAPLDTAACVTCLLLPPVAYLAEYWIGAFTERYVIFSVVNLMAALPLLVWAVAPARSRADLFAVAACLRYPRDYRGALSDGTHRRDPLDDHPIMIQQLTVPVRSSSPVRSSLSPPSPPQRAPGSVREIPADTRLRGALPAAV